ncbi:2-C-methyl-D-erythritol 4-phosphate cytidylyltransferase [Marisediminicola sp. LYQ85]|uniref:2-C-methyl-D-erythritol 4-phosphate cytidylyltransferase n=1 Tax=Marisediminicola sp. LYQ85 TaxID=3391062 RepID=UPI003983D8DB
MIGVIVVAAGSGTRLGEGRPKALVDLAGRSILARSLDAVFALTQPVRVVVVAPPTHLDETRLACAEAAGAAHGHLSVVVGGASRQTSVLAGLGALPDDVDIVLVHDCARAFTPTAQFEAVAAAVRHTGGGVIPALPVTDTIKRTDSTGAVIETPDRASLVAVQTPQGFPRDALAKAYASATVEHTDDASLFAAAGGRVTTVAGDALAFKITTPWDLGRAQQLARDAGPQRAPSVVTGIGIDVHAYDDESPLWLGGLFWPGERGLAGHSDGDAVSHAVCDALLSAAGLGDIGGRFGTSDARFSGAHGDVFLRETVRLVTDAGFTIANVAVQVVARAPKLAPRRDEMQTLLSALVGAPVSVSATTTDGLGFTGRAEGVAAVATVLLERSR